MYVERCAQYSQAVLPQQNPTNEEACILPLFSPVQSFLAPGFSWSDSWSVSCPESGTSHHGLGPTQELGEDMTDVLVVLESGFMGHIIHKPLPTRIIVDVNNKVKSPFGV